MLWKLVFLIIFSSLKGFALSYSLEKSEYYPALDIYEITQKLSAQGFYEVDLKKQGHLMNLDLDQMYMHSMNTEEMAILKLDLVLDNSQKVLKISDQEFVCHAQTSRGRKFSLYMKVEKPGDFTNVCDSFSKTTVTAQFKLFQLVINSARADSLGDCFSTDPSKLQLKSLQESVEQSSIIQGLGTCLSSALKGSKNTVMGMQNTLVALLNHPAELWKEVSEQAIALKNFLVHLKEEVILLKSALGNLDSELILQLGCQLGGEVLTSAGIAALTGAGIAKLSATMVQAVLKLKSMTSIMSRLTQLKKLGQGQLAKEVLSCAVGH